MDQKGVALMKREDSPVRRIKSEYVNEYHRQLKKSQQRKKWLMYRLMIAAVAITVLFGFLFVYHLDQRTTYADKKEEYEQLTEEATQLEAEKESLLEEITSLKDVDYILDIARTNYFLSKKGELIFQIDEGDSQSY